MRYILMLGLVALAGCVGSGQGGSTGSLPTGSFPSGSLPSSLSSLNLPSTPPDTSSVSSITSQAKQVLGGY